MAGDNKNLYLEIENLRNEFLQNSVKPIAIIKNPQGLPVFEVYEIPF